jgi:hypothetical protein
MICPAELNVDLHGHVCTVLALTPLIWIERLADIHTLRCHRTRQFQRCDSLDRFVEGQILFVEEDDVQLRWFLLVAKRVCCSACFSHRSQDGVLVSLTLFIVHILYLNVHPELAAFLELSLGKLAALRLRSPSTVEQDNRLQLVSRRNKL